MAGRDSDLRLFDAHLHFFSQGFFRALLAGRPGESRGVGDIPPEEVSAALTPLGVEAPPAEPETLADRWRDELDRHCVERSVLIASVPSDWPSVDAAVARHPDRFSGLALVDPRSPDAAATVHRILDGGRFRGICLFPAMHRYGVGDDATRRVIDVAREAGVLVFCHFGLLRVPIRERLGIRDRIDLASANPLDLAPLAADYPDVVFQVPHFGCGFLRETLLLGAQYPNVVVDTASSNSWIRLLPEGIDLRRVIEATLRAFGPERILWGSDSSVFPRGFRGDLLAEQLAAFESAGLRGDDRRLVFGGNARRIYGIEASG